MCTHLPAYIHNSNRQVPCVACSSALGRNFQTAVTFQVHTTRIHRLVFSVALLRVRTASMLHLDVSATGSANCKCLRLCGPAGELQQGGAGAHWPCTQPWLRSCPCSCGDGAVFCCAVLLFGEQCTYHGSYLLLSPSSAQQGVTHLASTESQPCPT